MSQIAPVRQSPPFDTTTPLGGTVQRGSSTVRVSVDPADGTVASAVGLSVAGMTVGLTRSLSSDPVRIATTGADGSARFENSLEGVYQASVDRPPQTPQCRCAQSKASARGPLQ